MSSYRDTFLHLKSMISELSKTMPSVLIRHLVIFSQYRGKCTKQHKCLFFFAERENIDIVETPKMWYEDVRYGCGKPKGHTFHL